MDRGLYEDDNKFVPWLKKIARNTTIDYLVKNSKMKTEEIDISTPETYNLEEQIEKRESMNQIEEAIESLPERYKTLVKEHYINNMKYIDIVEKYNLTMPIVKNTIHRAIIKIKNIIKQKENI